jgi:hypothetical protein
MAKVIPMRRKSAPRKAKVARKTPKTLSHTLYSYVTPTNGQYARNYGKRTFGSFSKYVDILIEIDRKAHFTQKLWQKTKGQFTRKYVKKAVSVEKKAA